MDKQDEIVSILKEMNGRLQCLQRIESNNNCVLNDLAGGTGASDTDRVNFNGRRL